MFILTSQDSTGLKKVPKIFFQIKKCKNLKNLWQAYFFLRSALSLDTWSVKYPNYDHNDVLYNVNKKNSQVIEE